MGVEIENNVVDEAATSENNRTETSTNATTNGEKDITEKQETVPFHKLFTFADSTDILLMIVGTIGAIGNGLGLPLMTMFLGEMIHSFGSNQSNIEDVVDQVSKVT
jgi:ATP-binding cassette, subfamily B (MDR/TAP), member 1